MDIKGTVALVTGANRGIGRAFVEALVERGAAKVYAGARDPKAVADLGDRHKGKVVPLKLDITQPGDIAAAAAACRDVRLLVNNAGITRQAGFIAASGLDAARAEMETNYFGPLSMCRAFAPILAANGGGAIINMLSILARVALPMYGSLCASKAAALSLTQGVRGELAKQGTLVVAVMPGAVDTEMERNFPPPKLPPTEAARAALDGVERGLEEVYPGDMATGMSQGLASDPKAVEKDLAKYLPTSP
jgi:NAD(P)-dependent dehydrogenase (short-subunit alcohol dehydrogenase family)